MKHIAPTRRAVLRAGLAATAAAVPWISAFAQSDYPSKPIRFIIGFPPGTGTDTWARLVAQRLGAAVNQPVIVDNRAGAHGQIACTAVKNADKDGYTLLYAAGGTMSINPALYGKKLAYDTLRDFDPVIGIERSTIYLAVDKKLPVTNLKEMIAYVKARSGAVNFGSAGVGTTSHLAMEMLKRAAGIDMTHVPYKGGGAVLQDLIGGQIQFAFDAAAVMLPQHAAGTIRLIGVASPTRLKVTPDIPTIAEQGLPGFDAPVWSGLYAPAGTPPAIVAKLNEVLNNELKIGSFDNLLNAIGGERAGGSSESFRKFVGQEIARWTVAVRESGVRPE